MNKDVIYIEPEDDITDVVNRIKSAKQKVVALVPPKKIGVLRSAINIKLIAKAAKQYEKAVVIVTVDPSVLKLAAATGVPVAKSLNSRPVIPKITPKKEPEANIETISEEGEEGVDSKSEKISKSDDKVADIKDKSSKEGDEKKDGADLHLNSAELEEEADKKDGKKADKKSDKKASKVPNFDKYRKFIIAGGILVVGLIVFLVWAFGFSGAAEIIVKIRASSSSFAESVDLVTKAEDADDEQGKILLEKVEYVKESSVEFTPTGEKDFGNKASGKLTATVSFGSGVAGKNINVTIPAGTAFSTAGLTFISTADVSTTWEGSGLSTCPYINGRNCYDVVEISVIAAEGGDKYNVVANSEWTVDVDSIVSLTNGAAFSGGTSDIVKVVTEEDIEKAREQLGTTEGKDELMSKVKDEMIALEASYSTKTDDPVSSPAVGEKAGEKATLKAKTTHSIYVVNRESVGTYIKTKVSESLGPDQIVYETGSPFFERFVENEGKYTAKLKTTIKSGPKVTEEDILEKARGKSNNEVKSLLKSINGISEVTINTPYPWVTSVPNDDTKITIKIEVEE